MYVYVNSSCLPAGELQDWVNEDITALTLSAIFQNYVKAYVELSATTLPANIYIDLDIFRAQYYAFSGTLNDVLTAIGNRTLVTVPGFPGSNITVAKYEDAVRVGYKVGVVKAGVNTPNRYPVADKHDLSITRPGYTTDLSLLHKYCLVSVNGYYHATDTDGHNAIVYLGADTMRKSNSNQMGLLSFIDVGELQKLPITPVMIANTAPLSTIINITTTAVLDGLSYILVLGGYLVFPEAGVFWRSSEHGFSLDITKIPYLERLLESNLFMDLSSLGLAMDPLDAGLAYSDVILTKYLTLSQSFLVLVNSPGMAVERTGIKNCKSPGKFITYNDPKTILVVGHGKVAEYWKVQEDRQWSMTVVDSYYRNFILSEQPVRYNEPGVSVSNGLNPENLFFNNTGFLLKISGYTL